MAVNKLIVNDEVLFDLTEDTVTEDSLINGFTAHDAYGNRIVGSRSTIDEEALDEIVTNLDDATDRTKIAYDPGTDRVVLVEKSDLDEFITDIDNVTENTNIAYSSSDEQYELADMNDLKNLEDELNESVDKINKVSISESNNILDIVYREGTSAAGSTAQTDEFSVPNKDYVDEQVDSINRDLGALDSRLSESIVEISNLRNITDGIVKDTFFDDATSGTGYEFYANRKVYKKGYVHSIFIKRKIEDEKLCEVVIVSADTNKIISAKSVLVNGKTNEIILDKWIDEDFILFVRCEGVWFKFNVDDVPCHRIDVDSDYFPVGDTVSYADDFKIYIYHYVKYVDDATLLHTSDMLHETTSAFLCNYLHRDGKNELWVEGNISDALWANKIVNPKGYVDSVKLYYKARTTAYTHTMTDTVVLVGVESNKVLAVGNASENDGKYIYIPIKQEVREDFYIFAHGRNVAYTYFKDNKNYYTTVDYKYSYITKGANFVPISWQSDNKFYVPYIIEYGSKAEKETTYMSNRFFCMGDSITAGYPYNGASANHPNLNIHWWDMVASQLGFKVTNAAQSGNGYLLQHVEGQAYGIKIVNDTDFSNYDVAVFAFGTNDYGASLPLGTKNDMYVEGGNNTVLGAVNYCIKTALNKNPNIALIISLPIYRKSNGVKKGCYAVENEAGYTLGDLCDGIISICDELCIPYIDHRHSPINYYTCDAMLVDGLHPSVHGYKVLGMTMASRIGTIYNPIRNN